MKYCLLCLLATCLPLGLSPEGAWGKSDSELQAAGCGEICVQLLCAYYHIDFPKQAVREVLRPGRRGETSLEEVKQALQLVGLPARAVRGDLDALRSTRTPMVLFVRQQPDNEIGHFAVAVWDPAQDRGLVCDPFASPHPISVTASDIQHVWTGHALLVEPPHAPYPTRSALPLYIALGFTAAALGVIAQRIVGWQGGRVRTTPAARS